MTETSQVSSFHDVREVGSLQARPLPEGPVKDEFKLRGHRFVEIKGRHHRDYEGSILQQTQTTPNQSQLLHYPVCSIWVCSLM
jgi:hypothetical protein